MLHRKAMSLRGAVCRQCHFQQELTKLLIMIHALLCFVSGAGGRPCSTTLRKRSAITNPLVGFESHHLTNKRRENPIGPSLLLFVVELEGFEPSSKRGTNMLSTCVVSAWFSRSARPGRPNISLSRRVSHRRPGAVYAIPDIPAPPYRLVSEKGQSGDVSSPQLLQG